MKNVIAVASGKGGVGKSTVAVNLAVALANLPKRPLNVALIDTDFYGPSVPTLMGGGEIKVDHESRFIPAKKFNVKYISIGFFLKNPDDPVIWRGPMFGKAISQLFQDVNWGDVDLTIVDMPPGTGDAQLSLSQMIQLRGAIVVTTPQEVALSDVRKAINMFRKVNVDVLGVVENMAGFVTPTGERFEIFGAGGGEALAEQFATRLLQSFPIDIAVREGGDAGQPIAADPSTAGAEGYRQLAENLLAVLDQAQAAPQLAVEN